MIVKSNSYHESAEIEILNVSVPNKINLHKLVEDVVASVCAY